MKPAALFCISSLGLGHATRTVPVLRSYLATHDVHVMSAGDALGFLRRELAGSPVGFHECRDYPPLERGKGSWKFYWLLVVDSLATVFLIRKEHAFVKELVRQIAPEFIFADGRYGSYAAGVPSVILSHQISFAMPRGFGAFKGLADWFNYRTFKKFDALIIPDYENGETSLAGALSHHPMIGRLRHLYAGILSSCERKAGPGRSIDYLFTVSGYLTERKREFIEGLMERAMALPGRKVFILGEPEGSPRIPPPHPGLEILASAAGPVRAELFREAKRLVSRCGYTTLMDMAELGIPGMLIPTPGQTEQEYLWELHSKRGDIANDLESLDRTGVIAPPWRTERSVSLVKQLIGDIVRNRPQG